MATEEEIYLMLRERKNEQEAKKNPKAKKTSNSSKKKAAMSEAERSVQKFEFICNVSLYTLFAFNENQHYNLI